MCIYAVLVFILFWEQGRHAINVSSSCCWCWPGHPHCFCPCRAGCCHRATSAFSWKALFGRTFSGRAMNLWTVTILTFVFLLLVLSSLLFGLVQNNILQDTWIVEGDVVCHRAIDGFYMHIRYIISTTFLLLSLVLRLITLPDRLACFQHPYATAFIGLLAFYMLVAGQGLVDMLLVCKIISEQLLAWLQLLSACISLLSFTLFYLFIISQENAYSYARAAPSDEPDT